MGMAEQVSHILAHQVSRWLFKHTKPPNRYLMPEGVALLAIEEAENLINDVTLHKGQLVDAGGRVMQQLTLLTGAYGLANVHREENTVHPRRYC